MVVAVTAVVGDATDARGPVRGADPAAGSAERGPASGRDAPDGTDERETRALLRLEPGATEVRRGGRALLRRGEGGVKSRQGGEETSCVG